MRRSKSRRREWSRREAMQAGAALGLLGLPDRQVAAASVPPEGTCIDHPIMTDAQPSANSPSRAPVDLAIQFAESSLSAAALNLDFNVAAAASEYAAESGPAKAAFSKLWPVNELRVFFMQNVSSLLIDTVMEFASEWSKHAKIKFVKSNNVGSSDIRVAFNSNGLHQSIIGPTPVNGRDVTMHLGMNDATVRRPYSLAVIMHEFGHAIGMVHEHQNPRNNPIRFADMGTLLAHYGRLGLNTADLITRNILYRYQDHELIRDGVSGFDKDSIMIYAIPGKVLQGGVDIGQTLTLSAKDKEFAARMYGPANGPLPTPHGGQGKPLDGTGSLTITLGGSAVEGVLRAGTKTECSLTIPSSDGGKNIAILTEGATQVMLTIADSSGKDITPDKAPQHGTYDLMNEVLSLPLAAGAYKVYVTHPSPRGGGTYKIQARVGAFDRPLAPPIRKL